MTGIETIPAIYVNSIDNGNKSGKLININEVGFYYFYDSLWVKFKQFTSGTVLNRVMLGSDETTIIAVNTSVYITILPISYKPVSNNTSIKIKYVTQHDITGFGTDDFFSNLTLNQSEITYNYR